MKLDVILSALSYSSRKGARRAQPGDVVPSGGRRERAVVVERPQPGDDLAVGVGPLRSTANRPSDRTMSWNTPVPALR